MTLFVRAACAALLSTAAVAALAQGAASPAKKELVQKALTLQQQGIENVGAEILNRSMGQLMQAASQALAQVPADKRQAVAQELQAEAKKFAEDNIGALKAAAARNAASTIGAGLEEKFSEDELKVLIAWLESPVNRKFQAFSAEAPDALARKVLSEVQPQLDPKFKALQQIFSDKLRAAAEMLDWHGSGMGVMEMSHRGKEFISIAEQAEADLRSLLAVPAHFRVLFMQGGGLGENAIVPLNLAARTSGGKVDVVVTGSWSKKSAGEAKRYADVAIAATNEADRHTSLPDPAGWQLRDGVSYVHLCSNETIDGVEYQQLPDLAALGCDAPLVIDCSSHILSRPIDWSRVGLAFAGAQKNIGPAGLTLVIVREDLLGHALPVCPSAFDYKTVADNGSMFNTPPTYAIYIAGLVFQWLNAQGGVAAMEARNIAKADLLYGCLDGSGFYVNRVVRHGRSRMNVPFFLPDDRLNEPFLAGAKERGLLQLKGHKSVGGMRASIYNAMPLEGVQALVAHLKDFAQRHG